MEAGAIEEQVGEEPVSESSNSTGYVITCIRTTLNYSAITHRTARAAIQPLWVGEGEGIIEDVHIPERFNARDVEGRRYPNKGTRRRQRKTKAFQTI
jgi:hypothetical protein